MSHERHIFIDFGTSSCCAAVGADGDVNIVINECGNATTPCCVAFNDLMPLFGEAAENQAPQNPESTVFGVMSLIGRRYDECEGLARNWPFKVIADSSDKPMIEIMYSGETRTFYPEEILAFILHQIKQMVGEHGRPDFRITLPGHFNKRQRQAITDACTIAGINARFIHEPVAVAMGYAMSCGTRVGQRNILIYTMGSSFLNVCVCILEDMIIEVKAVAGDARLGGSYFDNRIMEYCIDDFCTKNQSKHLGASARALCRLRSACERAKCALSSATSTVIEIESLYDGVDYHCTLTRDRFEDLCRDNFSHSLDPVERCLRDSGIDRGNIHEVVLAGGSTRIPKVKELVQEFFAGRTLVTTDSQVVARNMVAYSMHEDSMTLQVRPLSLGIQTPGGIMTKLVERCTIVPTRGTHVFTTYVDNQANALITMFEGECAMTKDNICIGKFYIDGIPPAPAGVPQIEITLDVGYPGYDDGIKLQVQLTSSGRQGGHDALAELPLLQAIQDISITCQTIGDGIVCTNMAGEEVARFNLPPGTEHFGGWVIDKLLDGADFTNRIKDGVRFVLIDPEGNVISTRVLGLTNVSDERVDLKVAGLTQKRMDDMTECVHQLSTRAARARCQTGRARS